jgi:hypothetical protein
MNSSSAFKQRSGARTQRKSADKGEREVFIQSAGGGAAEDSTFARDYARDAAAKNKRSWADVVSGQRKEKGKGPEASFIQSANAAREQENAAASAAGSEIKPPPRAFTYAEVVSGAAKQQRAKKNLLDEEEQARAAFAALASSRARVDIDLSRIAADDDNTILLDQGKGDDVEAGAGNDNADTDGQQEDGRDADADGQHEDHRDVDEDNRDGDENNRGGYEDGHDGDGETGDGGEDERDAEGFVWDKKARRADERRRREEERSQVATKAARKLEDLERKLQEEEAAKREASALRKRNRDKSPRASSQPREPAEESGASASNQPVNAKPPLFPVFSRQPQRKALAKANAKEAKKAQKSQRSEGLPYQDSISDRQRTPDGERRVAEPPSDDGQNEGDDSRQRRDAYGGEGDRRVRRRGDTEVPAAASSRRERRALDKSVRASSKRVEFERHRLNTDRREKGRESARDLVKAALYQLKRQSKGELLDSNEQQLATYAAHLSPAKILGAGIRIGAASSGEGSESEDGLDLLEATKDSDESVDELVEELGCSAAEARDALNRSCRWTASGNSSRIKAANWLRRELEEQENRRQYYRCFPPPRRTQATGGLAKRDDHRDKPFDTRGRLPQTPAPTQGRSGTSGSAPATRGENFVNRQSGRNPVPTSQDGSFDSSLHRNGANPSSSSEFSSESSLSDGSESNSDSSDNGANAKRRKQASGSFLSLDRSRKAPADRHESRYLRNLVKLLLIDESEAKEVYAQTQAKVQSWNRSVTMFALVETFYLREVRGAKGTQAEHARSLDDGDKPPGGPSPTFTLPDWSSGQPPIGGLHFSTLKDMLAAYEKFERQTNYQTSVTFKSMIKTTLRPSFESKCKLPRTVWKNPIASDASRVMEGKPEEGGWSDMRFLAAVRRALAPIGRTVYEIAFEKLKLFHRGTDTQLEVTLSIWGEKWLAKEREAEEQNKTLPVPKMKILFKNAVSSVAKFKRWLEGRAFISSSDWFEVLSRKLHKSLGKTQEDEHDNRDYRHDSNYDGGSRGTWRGRGYEMRGGGETRGGASRGGGDAPRGSSHPYRGGSSSGHDGSRRDSGRDAQGLSSYQFSAPPGRTNHISGSNEWEEQSEWHEGEHHGSWHDETQGDSGWGNGSEDGSGRFNAAGAHGHSGGAEPMTYSPAQNRGRGGFRGGRGGGEARSPRKPVNDPSEDTVERLKKGVRWHDSTKANCQCRDPGCGTRQDVPYCQGCGMHGHDRMFCFKSREAQYNSTGYWDANRPNQPPIQGLRGIRSSSGDQGYSAGQAATSRGNMMDATGGSS